MIYTEYEADALWLDAEADKPEPWWQTPELLPHEQQWMAEIDAFCKSFFDALANAASRERERPDVRAADWSDLPCGEGGQVLNGRTGQWEWPAGPLQDWDWYDDDPLEPDEGADDEQA